VRGEPADVRFWAKVDATGICWEWTACRDSKGYGRFRDGTLVGAHRWSWEHLVGPIPEGLVIDHLCRNPPCVNPDHLEPVTHRENVIRGLVPHVSGEWKRRITHCPQGHPYDEANTRHSAGHRFCRACDRQKQAERKARRKREQDGDLAHTVPKPWEALAGGEVRIELEMEDA
jgi:hypothetical protein